MTKSDLDRIARLVRNAQALQRWIDALERHGHSEIDVPMADKSTVRLHTEGLINYLNAELNETSISIQEVTAS